MLRVMIRRDQERRPRKRRKRRRKREETTAEAEAGRDRGRNLRVISKSRGTSITISLIKQYVFHKR